jgi:hypothetical protein
MKKILYVDLDNVIVDFPSAFPRLSPAIFTEYETGWMKRRGFFP